MLHDGYAERKGFLLNGFEKRFADFGGELFAVVQVLEAGVVVKYNGRRYDRACPGADAGLVRAGQGRVSFIAPFLIEGKKARRHSRSNHLELGAPTGSASLPDEAEEPEVFSSMRAALPDRFRR